MKASIKCRVLMLLENNAYPSDQRVRREANSLVAAGFQVTVISPAKKNQQQPRYENVDGVHVYRFPPPPAGDSFLGYLWEYGWSLFCSFFLTLWVFFRRGFDVIHAHNPPDIFVLIAICYRILGKQFVFDHHDLSPEMYYARFRNGGRKSVFKVLEFFEKLSCRWAHQIISTNESYKKVEIARAKVSPDKITVVRNGPDIFTDETRVTRSGATCQSSHDYRISSESWANRTALTIFFARSIA